MLLLVSGATLDARMYDVGVLLEPRGANFESVRDRMLPRRWAADNAAYTEFDEPAFIAMLDRCAGIPGCLFVAAPDVVADAAATLAAWPRWRDEIASRGLPPALVAQDGLRPEDVPWGEMGALFIGGSTAFKLGPLVAVLAGEARARGLWVHMGRVNTRRRIRHAHAIGCDSFDGSGFSRWPATRLPLAAAWIAQARSQGRLF